MNVLFALAMVSPESHPTVPILIVGDYCATFSQCSQVFSRIKTECAHLAESARPLLFSLKMMTGTMSLSGIFNHFETKPISQG